jgi:hypothetical protein
MEDVLEALGNALKYLFGAVIYLMVFVPLALACFALGILSIPLDLLVFALSFGQAKFAIFGALCTAAIESLSWYADHVLD